MLDLLREALAATLDQLKQTISSAVRSLVLLLVAGVLLLVGLVFLLLGFYQSLSAELPAWQAGGIVLLGVLVIVVVLVLLASRSGRSPKRSQPGDREPDEASRDRGASAARKDDIDAAVAAELGASVWDFLKRRRPRAFEMLVASFVAGLLMSRRERSRPDDDEPPRRRWRRRG